jgi:autotransporter translocation and assembly factor TamB
MKLLESAGAKGIARSETPFDRLTADFAVVQGVAATKNLEFRSADLDFDGKGTVGLGGALRLDVLGSFSREVSAQLVAKTHALSMRVDDTGRLSVPLQIRGTVQAPRVQLDLDTVIQEGVVKELKKEGTKSLMKKLFGR